MLKNWLYSRPPESLPSYRSKTFDEVIETIKADALKNTSLESRWSIESLRVLCWYHSQAHPGLSLMREAHETFTNFKEKNWISLNINLEDELTLIFYIFIYHEESVEKKKDFLDSILTELTWWDFAREILTLCEREPLKYEYFWDPY